MTKPLLISIFVFLSCSSLVNAETSTTESIHSLETKGYAMNYITPIFSQLLAIRAPKSFHIDYEESAETQYILESVPNGETVKNWSQMFTLTGYKNLASNPKLKPINLVQGTANGFNKACPSSFSAKSLWKGKVSGFDAFAAVLGCGISPTTDGKTSEMALIIAIKGAKDFYTIQFAERNKPSASPIEIDTNKWLAIFKQMTPIKLCKKVHNEKAPYPSCIGNQ